MELLTKIQFDTNLNYKDIISKLRIGDEIVIIEEFPLSDFDYQSFIRQIGTSIYENRNNNRQDIYDVKISKQNNLFRSIANSNLTFPLHTDCADFDSIPNCIGLLCVQPANLEQGTNKFIRIKEILKLISTSEILELSNKKWKFRNQSRSIINIESGEHKICYDRITIESFSKITREEKNQLNKLDKIFEKNSFQIKLKKGDLVLFRNDLMLHGRTGIDINSNRLVKRIRFNIN